jgi:GntR family transcriptional regulator
MDILDRRSLLPLYYQLAHHLRQEIYAGGLQPGHGIPSERELMRTHNLSRNTVRQALDMLAKEGLVVRDHGHGTFVSKLVHKFEYMLETFYENWDLLERAGFTPSVDFVSSEAVVPPEPARMALRLEKNDLTTCHTMIFYADNRPAMFTMDYLPGVFPEKYDLTTSGEGFIPFLDRISGIQVEYVLVDISAEEAVGIIAETFKCPPGTPVMLYREVFLDSTQSKPIAYSMNYFNRDVMNFRLLTRRGSA